MYMKLFYLNCFISWIFFPLLSEDYGDLYMDIQVDLINPHSSVYLHGVHVLLYGHTGRLNQPS